MIKLIFLRKLVEFFPAHMLLFRESLYVLSKKIVMPRKVSEIFVSEFFAKFAQIEKREVCFNRVCHVFRKKKKGGNDNNKL